MGMFRFRRTALFVSVFIAGLLFKDASAEMVTVTVTVRNLAPTNSISFAPLRLGFGNGTFDSFNINQTAGNPIISIAEGGSGSDWFPAFAAAEPDAVLGSVGGALLPGATASNSFVFDSSNANNRFFTFGTMVIPSNDLFLGNDSPTAFQIFNPDGTLAISNITQNAGQIWDSNSEVAIAANAAFLQGGTNGLRVAENGTVAFDRSELSVYDGLTTAAGYTFDSTLLGSNATPVYSIDFSVSAVPEPSSIALFASACGGIVFLRRRNRQKSA